MRALAQQWLGRVEVAGGTAPPVQWSPEVRAGSTDRLARWAAGVGPARLATATERMFPVWPLRVVAWNAQVGHGSLRRLWEHVAGGGGASRCRATVALLQEVYSAGAEVPELSPGALWAPRIGGNAGDAPAGSDIASFVQEAGLSLVYIPSMRNGGGPYAEDRGCAIVSNLPLLEPQGIELPLERQRRVAVVASVALGDVTLRLCSLHLENRAPWRRAWRTLHRARTRQMEALLAHFPGSMRADGFVLGGDFNTWVRGRRERAYRRARRRFPGPTEPDDRPTHHFELGGLLRHSDHLLFRLPAAWGSRYHRLDDTFGSDHYPLVGVLTPPG